MKEGKHYNIIKKNKKTLTSIAEEISKIDKEENYFKATYQDIKRIRTLLNESLSIVDFNDLKGEYYFIKQMIEFVYRDENLENALKRLKKNINSKDKDINIEDYYMIIQALDLANIKKEYLEKNEDFHNIYRLLKSIIEMNNTYIGMTENIFELFKHDEEKAIDYTYIYRDKMLVGTNDINKKILIDKFSFTSKVDTESLFNEIYSRSVDIKVGDSIEKYNDGKTMINIDCKGKYVDELDLSMYKMCDDIVYTNLKYRTNDSK